MKNIIKSIKNSTVYLLLVLLSGCAGMTDADWEALGAAAAAIDKSKSSRSSSTTPRDSPSTSSTPNAKTSGSQQAAHCVSAVRKASGGVDLTNTCNYSVEVAWCVRNYDCKYGSWGFVSTRTLGSGTSYPVSGSLNRSVNFGACSPANSNIVSVTENRYQCRSRIYL